MHLVDASKERTDQSDPPKRQPTKQEILLLDKKADLYELRSSEQGVQAIRQLNELYAERDRRTADLYRAQLVGNPSPSGTDLLVESERRLAEVRERADAQALLVEVMFGTLEREIRDLEDIVSAQHDRLRPVLRQVGGPWVAG